MELFISYSRSARVAEAELLRLFETSRDAYGHRSIFAPIEGNGWSPMLPGIVCNVDPSGHFEAHPAKFVGFLEDDLLISCKLSHKFASNIDPKIMQLLDSNTRAYSLGAFSSYAKRDRITYIASVPDSSITVRSIHHNSIFATPAETEHADRLGPAGRPMVGSILELVRGEGGEVDDYLADVLLLLFETMDGTGHPSSVRKLAREHNCRFAWTSMRLGRQSQSEMPARIEMSYRTSEAAFEKERAGVPPKIAADALARREAVYVIAKLWIFVIYGI